MRHIPDLMYSDDESSWSMQSPITPSDSFREELPSVERPSSLTIVLSHHEVFAWLCFFAVLLLQYFLFREYILREVIWRHPSAFDQAEYLVRSYEAFERLRSHGLVRGLWE